jgi:hypothetical protein
MEHYGCAVDILGCARRLDKAKVLMLIVVMPVPPNVLVRAPSSRSAACGATSTEPAG